MCIISIKDLSFSYEDKLILDNISLDIKKGEYLTILGRNGSGKSTLARIINGLLKPSSGSVLVYDKNEHFNRYVGMVFQNPDNQFVSSIVKEDVSFYPRNLGLSNIDEHVDEALKMVDMFDYKDKSTYLLSGGQKQRIALAAVLSGNPDVLILDEVTSMLDVSFKEDLLKLIANLHKQGKTIISITHDVYEILDSDRVIVLNDGKIVRDDVPSIILNNQKVLSDNGIEVPYFIRLYNDLLSRGIKLDKCPLNEKELLEALCQLN